MSTSYVTVDVAAVNAKMISLGQELLSLQSQISLLAKNHKPVLYKLEAVMNKHEGALFEVALEGEDIYEKCLGGFLLQKYLRAGNIINLGLVLDVDNNNFYYELVKKMSQFLNDYVPEEKRYLVLGEDVVRNMCEANVSHIPIYFKDKWTDIDFLNRPSELYSKDWKKFYSPEDTVSISSLLEAIKSNFAEAKDLHELLKKA